jgi:hypothetical protein
VSGTGFDSFQGPPGRQPAESRGDGDPVSWLQIEPGWSVVDAGGGAVGAVAQITGSKEDDIFDGLAVQVPGSAALVYVPGEVVAAIYPERVALKITAAQTAELSPYSEAPPQQALTLPRESLTTRFKHWFNR